MNCIDNTCKYVYADYTGELFCSLTQSEVPEDIDIMQCYNFEMAKNCLTCRHARYTIYETGTIDDIEYRCPLQDNKLIYDDLEPYLEHHADIPECNIGKWKGYK